MTRFLTLLALPLLAACAVKQPPSAEAPAARSGPNEATLDRPVAYADYARQRERVLDDALDSIEWVVLPAMRAVREELAEAIDALPHPEMFASMQRDLRAWGVADRLAYREKVDALYGEAGAELERLFDQALRDGEARAQAIAVERSPLDEGVTGDQLLDRQLVAFDETLREVADLSGLDAQRQQDRLDEIELVEVFSSFTHEGADARFGGRLMLFVGGDELAGVPVSHAILRLSTGVDAEDRRVFQAVRHRVMRGETVVDDLGWRPMPLPDPGFPTLTVVDDLLVSGDIAPVVNDAVPGFAQLIDMRIVVDMQCAVLDGQDRVLGGVDWRVEYRVSSRGTVSWQLAGGRPLYVEDCPVVRSLLNVN